MSGKGTLDFFFSKQKIGALSDQNVNGVSIESTLVEDLCDRTSTSDNLTMHSSDPSLSMAAVISLDGNEETTAQRPRIAMNTEDVEPFKRDPCRGPMFAKEFILLGPYQPKCHYPTIQRRHFCHDWFGIYKWLEYSEANGKAYCFPCRFSYNPIKSDKSFTVDGFECWKNGVGKFNKHQSTLSHKLACETLANARKIRLSNETVLNQIDRCSDKQSEENRLYLVEIIRTIVFLAKQGLALRGHREDDESSNRGNFLELLDLRCIDNEIIRRNVRSLKYTDHKIQNELLLLIQTNITNQIIREIEKSKYFSVMIDETSDIANHEQVSLVIRYIDDLFNVFERFIGFGRTVSTSGESLFNLLISWVKQLGLNVRNIVGQCYDGASSMRGEYKGVAARLTHLSSKGRYSSQNWSIRFMKVFGRVRVFTSWN
jgi:Domain of unknown function (DUF4371)